MPCTRTARPVRRTARREAWSGTSARRRPWSRTTGFARGPGRDRGMGGAGSPSDLGDWLRLMPPEGTGAGLSALGRWLAAPAVHRARAARAR